MKNFPQGTEVNVVAAPEKKGGSPNIVKGTVDEMLSRGAARITTANGGSIQASYSNGGEIGTFHQPFEQKEVKASLSFGEPAAPAPAEAAASGSNSKS